MIGLESYFLILQCQSSSLLGGWKEFSKPKLIQDYYSPDHHLFLGPWSRIKVTG